MKFFKSKWLYISLAVVLLLTVISYNVGSVAATTTLKDKKVDYNTLVDKIQSKKDTLKATKEDISTTKDKLNNTKAKLDDKQAALDSKQEELSEAHKLISKRDDIKKEIDKLEDDLSSIKSDVKKAKDKLDSLETGIERAKGDPITLGAGYFAVGKDIPPGRYKVVPTGTSSNFVVYDSNGGLAVNTILGDYGVPSYVVGLGEGFSIENSAPFKFIPVK